MDVAASHLNNPSVNTTFESVAAIFALVESKRTNHDSDSIVVAPTSVKQYEALVQERDTRGDKIRLFYLGAQTRILILTIPTASHETMHATLSNYLVTQIAQMVPYTAYNSSASATHTGPSHSRGEADGNLFPFPARAGADQWPTIVFESGYSQSEAALRAKMQWWFRASNHAVKIMLIAKAFPHTAERRLMIEQWQGRSIEAVRSGATATRRSTAAGDALQPTCLQAIDISWAGPVPFDEAIFAQVTDSHFYNVVRAPLALEFALMMLRPAVGPREHDVLFPAEFLQFCAAAVWSSTRQRHKTCF